MGKLMNARRFVLILGAVAVIATAATFAQRAVTATPASVVGQVAVIDTQRVFDDYSKTKGANSLLEKAAKRLEEEAIALETEISELEDRLEKQRLFIDDPAKLREMEQQIAAKEQTLTKLVNTGRAALEGKQNELSEPILKEIRASIQEVGKRDGYEMILEKQFIVLYHRDALDITDSMVSMLNERAAAEPKTPPTETTPDQSGSTRSPSVKQE